MIRKLKLVFLNWKLKLLDDEINDTEEDLCELPRVMQDFKQQIRKMYAQRMRLRLQIEDLTTNRS